MAFGSMSYGTGRLATLASQGGGDVPAASIPWAPPWMQEQEEREEEERLEQARRDRRWGDICHRVGVPSGSWEDICSKFMPPRLGPLAEAMKSKAEGTGLSQAAADARSEASRVAAPISYAAEGAPRLASQRADEATARRAAESRLLATQRAAEAAALSGNARATRYAAEREARRKRLFEVDPEVEKDRKAAEVEAAARSSMFDFDDIPDDSPEESQRQ
eukprot:CAMPEP_0197894672 /NCGR_PEP_ID=MMETSP1439-20131203/35957_1 /TAXON_ID=66791 /ORGANISM="Gonyaulax spinifera, Strain CCMP409" /LENGTH=218 /DNA_ID=CAMNT_0043515053 /DNA_START=57 /DNA_END=713 /DNA_ORIENTATION=-